MAARQKFTADLADGRTIEVAPDLRDSLAAESAFRKNKGWGPTSENPIKFGAYRIWSAARRDNLTDLEWTDWIDGGCIDFALVPESDDEDDAEYPLAAATVAPLGEDTPTAESPS